MLCKVMLVVPSCLEEGWKGMEAVPVAVCWVTAPKGEVAGAPKAGAGAVKISSDKIHVWCLRMGGKHKMCPYRQMLVLEIQRRELLGREHRIIHLSGQVLQTSTL